MGARRAGRAVRKGGPTWRSVAYRMRAGGCIYRIVRMPKYGRKVLYGETGRGDVVGELKGKSAMILHGRRPVFCFNRN